MARAHRYTPGGYVYHVCNRGSRKGSLFSGCADYAAYLRLLDQALHKRPMRIVAYSLMRTHVHLLLWPRGDADLPLFMQWLTAVHARRWHRERDSVGTGAVYQSRYRMVPIFDLRHYFTALRYVERNAREAGVVQRAEDWPWCSAHSRAMSTDPGPCARPSNWIDVLNDL
jgi:putative transposase